MFLTCVFSICGINLFIQMITVKMHLTRPPRAVPQWLKTLRNCLSLRFACRDNIEQQTTNREVPLSDLQVSAVAQKQVDKKSPAGTDAALIAEIRVLSKKVKSDAEDDALSDEWKSFADFFNTFFLCLSMTAQLITAAVCFGIIPILDHSPIWINSKTTKSNTDKVIEVKPSEISALSQY